jgi:predicted anti-sigma-YlaC factor YlaD
MDCKAVQKVIYRFVYGESDSTELLQVKRHLDRCRECDTERELISDILSKIRSVAESETSEALPEGCRDRILSAIHKNIAIQDRTS